MGGVSEREEDVDVYFKALSVGKVRQTEFGPWAEVGNLECTDFVTSTELCPFPFRAPRHERNSTPMLGGAVVG